MRLARLPVAALALLAACRGASDAPGRTAPAAPEADDALAAFTPAVVHWNDELGVPTFTWLRRDAGAPFAASATPEAMAWAAVRRSRTTLRLGDDALATTAMREVDAHGAGTIVARLEQKVAGVDVFRARLRVAMTRTREPVALAGFLAPAVTPRAGHAEFALGEIAAAGAALRAMTGRSDAAFAFAREDDAGYAHLVSEGAKARVKRVWYPRTKGLDAAYRVEVEVERGAADSDARAYVVDARDGRVLFESALVAADAYTYRAFADGSGGRQPWDGPLGNATAPHPTGSPSRLQLPFVEPNLVTLASSPFSRNDPWLAPGATGTSGNNVDAYADLFAPDGFSAGDLRPTPSAGAFDFAYDAAKAPDADATQQQASVVQLFYTVNFLHDWFYDAGFDEPAGNSQNDNFGRGGAGGDAIRAEAQDRGGANNANALTPADGSPPRIQMYLFDPPPSIVVDVSPAIADLGEVIAAPFGATSPHDVDAAVVLPDDGFGAPTDACEPLVGDVAGKIVLVAPAVCSFERQVANAAAAGAAAVLASGATPATLPVFEDDPSIATAITIPAIGIAKPKADAIREALGTGAVTARLRRTATGPRRDSALELGIVAHEWGHTMVSRLVDDSSGLVGPQARALGEGLSDFVSLLAIVRGDDVSVTANASWGGTYGWNTYLASGGETNGIYFGHRRYPYSTDLAKNPLTFRHIEDSATLPGDVPLFLWSPSLPMSAPHGAGEVFASMLWECYAGLLRDSPRLTFAEAQARMKRYLVAALKLIPDTPTFLEARDAFLAAALAGDAEDYRLFVAGFAKRGAGYGAIAPARTEPGNAGVVESFDAVGKDLEVVGTSLRDDVRTCDQDGVLDDGEVGKLVVTLRNVGFSHLTGVAAKVTTTTPGVTLGNGGAMTFAPAGPHETVAASVDVALTTDSVALAYALDVAITADGLSVPRTITTRHESAGNFDARAASSAIDRVDSGATAWTKSSANGSAGPGFERRTSGGDGYWHVDDGDGIADHSLVSPPLHVSASEPLTLAFETRWKFEADAAAGHYFDGAVVEISDDDGATWSDVADRLTPTYGGTLVTDTLSPLGGRAAFVGESPGYPALTQVTASFGSTYAGKTVKLRFRFASDQSAGAPGWDIDDIALTGLTDAPFVGRAPDAAPCLRPPPPPSATPAPSPPSPPPPSAPPPPPTTTPAASTAPDAPPATADGGCAVRRSGDPSRSGACLALALALLGVARRRARGAHGEHRAPRARGE